MCIHLHSLTHMRERQRGGGGGGGDVAQEIECVTKCVMLVYKEK